MTTLVSSAGESFTFEGDHFSTLPFLGSSFVFRSLVNRSLCVHTVAVSVEVFLQ